MAEYRTVRKDFWNDPYIEELDAKAKLLYVYMFTGPHTNNLGILEVTRRKISYETGLTISEVDKHLEAFEAAGKVVCDLECNLILMVNFIKHQSSTSPKILEGLQKLAPLVPSPIIAEALYIRYPGIYDVPANPGDTVSIPYAYGIHTLYIPSGEKEREIGKGNGIWKGESGKGKEEGEGGRGKGEPRTGAETQSAKERFGENGNVRLTPEEYARLCLDYGEERTRKTINFFDGYIAEKGSVKSKSHNLTMRRWVFSAVKEREERETGHRARASPQTPRERGLDATVRGTKALLEGIKNGEL